ncbi:MAG TPA: DUF6526 family protein [Bacteroidia bacterium]|jgi:hypothetical protein|nr:DUF6526 family protein [Bacteroidia bacterium]
MSEQSGQNFANHARFVPLYHYFQFALVTATLIGSFVNLTESIMHHEGVYSASLIACLAVFCSIAVFQYRAFAIRAQDRAIRAEENFRHFVMTGKPHDSRLKIGQVIALRFASDEEFVALSAKAAAEGMEPKEIKKAIKNWRGDYHRA